MKKTKFFIILIILNFLISTSTYADSLIIQPTAGREPILQKMEKAKSIDLIMYGFTDPAFIDAFIAAKKSGKNVNILLEPLPYKNAQENIEAMLRFKKENVNLFTPNPSFQLTHQKTFIFDREYALVMTFNLTRQTFKNQRNFAIFIHDPSMVKEIDAVFKADAQHVKITPMHPNLIWSPDNSRQKLLNLINDSEKEIKIYAQSVSDYQIIGALSKAAKRGVKVQILTEPHNPQQKKWSFLKKSGVEICFEHPHMIHAKVLMIDKKRFALGSINLTKPSLDRNRELSVISEDKNILRELLKTFSADWRC